MIDSYFDQIISVNYNVYEGCFMLYKSLEPFFVEIRFQCFFLTPTHSEKGPCIKHVYKLTEAELRSIYICQSMEPVALINFLCWHIEAMICSVEQNAEYLTGLIIDRHFTKVCFEHNKSLLPKF